MCQVLDSAPAPTPRVAPPVMFEWIKLDGSAVLASVETLENGKVSLRDSRGSKLSLSLSEVASVWRASSTHAFAQGRTRSAPIQVIPSEDGSTPAAPRREWNVELTDGQRLIGELSAEQTSAADSMAFKLSPSSNVPNPVAVERPVLALAIDRIHRMSVDQIPFQRTVVDAGRDVIWLANGDVLTGFVSSIGQKIGIETTPAAGSNQAKVQELHQDAVSAIAFTNPLVSAKGMLVAFEDGSVMNAANMSILGEQCDLTLALNPTAKLQPPTSTISWLLPHAERWRSLAANAAGPSNAMETVPAGLLLKEPGTFSWAVQPGESTFVAQFNLPPACFDWGNFTLIIKLNGKSGSRETARLHFDADTPNHRVAIPLSGASALECTIDPGTSGPVQDRLLISRAGFISGSAK